MHQKVLDKKIVKRVSNILIESINEIDEKDVSIAFSGGIDSSLIALLANNFSQKIENIGLYYAGLKGKHDYFNSIKSAELLDLQVNHLILNEKEIIICRDEIGKIINSNNLIEISYLLPFYAVLKNTKQKVIIMGQGSDELFMGYHKFLLNPEKAQELSKELYFKLWEIIPNRENKLAEHFDKKLYLPFMNKNLEKLILPLGLEYKIMQEETKILLRQAAQYLDLPYEIVNNPKKAAQYGSGIWKVLKNSQK